MAVLDDARPLLGMTMGDVAGVGPELIAQAWAEPALHQHCRPLVVGDPGILRRACQLAGSGAKVVEVAAPEAAEPTAVVIPCLVGSAQDLGAIVPGRVDGRAGRAAYDFLVTAIDLARAGRIAGITTLPLNKEGLRAGGIEVPGHTEVLAERCGVASHAMMLYLPPSGSQGPAAAGLGVVHATLHVALRSVFELLTVASVAEAIRLADEGLRPLLPEGRSPRLAVAGLNPHAGEHGLFGEEEATIIGPAVALAQTEGRHVIGPLAADTLFARALAGEFDGVVAMYHDQGHVALKSVGFARAVNITLGLPIVRTSVAHGTAYDIAGTGQADPASLLAAVRCAGLLIARRFGNAPRAGSDARDARFCDKIEPACWP